MSNPLDQVHEGMKVYDNTNQEIGTVDYVHLSDENVASPVAETAGVSPAVRDNQPHTLVGDVMKVFEPDDIPNEMRNRLLREGFVRLDAHGLFKADRYIFPDQIRAVSGDQLTLNVEKDALIKRA